MQLHPELILLLPKDLRAFCVTAVHQKGERLFASGSKPVNMFFVGSGEVILERLGAQGGAAVLQRTRHGLRSPVCEPLDCDAEPGSQAASIAVRANVTSQGARSPDSLT